MRTKIKHIAYSIVAFTLVAPVTVSAQFGEGLSTAENAELPEGTITGILTNVMFWITALIAIFGIIGFAIAGILYLTAAGDEDRINMAKRAMFYSIIGVVVALLGFVILQAANTMLGGEESTF
jgi:phosphoglycerol transferase MdoB-like AlkP superfamily enzyme